MKNWNWKNWNWWKKDNSTLDALKEALDELNQKTWELNYYKEYTDSLKRELATKERTIATYSNLYNSVADEVDTLKEKLKEYDELVGEDWTE